MTLALYAPSLSGAYVYEDVSPSHLWQAWPGFKALASGAVQRPHRSLSTLVWHAVGAPTGYAPAWQRGASLGLHLFNAILLWALAQRIRLGLLAATVAVGLFLLHPLHIEAVASVAYRSELLIGLSVLLALHAVERGRWVVAALAVLAACLAKDAGIVAYALVPLWAVWRGQRVPRWWLLSCAPAVLVIGLWLMTLGLRWTTPMEMAETVGAWGWLLLTWGFLQPESLDPDWARRLTPLALTALAVAWIGLLSAAWRWRGWWTIVACWALAIVAPRLPWPLGEGLHAHHLYTMTLVLSLAAGALCTRKATQ